MAGLHAIQEVLDQPMLKCKKEKNVHWLSHDMAIKAVICTYPGILLVLIMRHQSVENLQHMAFYSSRNVTSF